MKRPDLFTVMLDKCKLEFWSAIAMAAMGLLNTSVYLNLSPEDEGAVSSVLWLPSGLMGLVGSFVLLKHTVLKAKKLRGD